MSFEKDFLQHVIKRFENYKELGEKTFEQLNEEYFLFKPSPESNSIAIIVEHLKGNMISRWTNFLTEDGEKPWRKRDAEFEEKIFSENEVINHWNAGWNCLFDEIKKLQPEDLTKTIFIRNEPFPVYDAILRQLAHAAYHVGQIITIAKMIKDANWHSLTIAKGQSEQYLEQMKNNFK